MSTDPEAPGDQLEESYVRVLYRALLGRDPSPVDVAYHLKHSPTTRAFLDIVLGSDEYLSRNPAVRGAGLTPPMVANLWHPDLAQWTHKPGTRSQDEVAIVGSGGWVFIHGGSNQFVPQFTGELAMAPDWLDRWGTLMAGRQEEAAALGCRLASLVVPEKLAIHVEDYGEALEPVGPRPIERLLQAGLPLAYPVAALREARARGQVCLRTDSHLTIFGNCVLHEQLLRDLGTTPVDAADLPRGAPHLTSGDLGQRYDPRILEVIDTPLTMGIAELVEDNWPAIARTGGHIGTRRVYSSPTAPDPRTVVLFGDSYGFGAETYQGTAWFLAQAFRETHFVWAPFGWDPGYVERVGADVVVSETAERFVARVPLERVDVGALAADALSKDTFVAVDEIFADTPPDAV